MMRKTKGRQKMEMVKMANESNLQVTFSKRRSGLFKKASELCTLCGAEVAIVVFSPSKKVFSFGHPCLESVVDQYVTKSPPPASSTRQLMDAHRKATAGELNMELTQVLNKLEAEKERGEELNQLRKASQSKYWWQFPVDELSPSQLELLKALLEDLKIRVSSQREKVMMESCAALQQFPGSTSSNGGPDFNPNNMNMMPPPPPPPHQPILDQPHQPYPCHLPPPQPHQPYYTCPLPPPPPHQPVLDQPHQPYYPCPLPPPPPPPLPQNPNYHPRNGFNPGFGPGFN